MRFIRTLLEKYYAHRESEKDSQKEPKQENMYTKKAKQ